MSLILDALKKSEAERQRQSGPTLLEVRVTSPRRRLPIWALALGALLLANAALLAWFLWLRPAPLPEPAAQLPAAASAGVPPAAAAGSPGTHTAVPLHVAASAAPSAARARIPGTPAGAGSDANAADFEPAVPASFEASTRRAGAAGSAAEPSDSSSSSAAQYTGLPTLAELGGSVPPMHLDLLVHNAANPDQSYALINMHKAHAGDQLPEGATVVAITREGVVLDYRGRQFMLTPR